MFLLVIGLVTVLVWFRPRNLMFDQLGHLVESGKVIYGSNERPMTRETLKELPNTEEGGA